VGNAFKELRGRRFKKKQSVGPTEVPPFFFDLLTTPVAILNPDSAFLLTSDDKVHAKVSSPFFELGSLSPHDTAVFARLLI